PPISPAKAPPGTAVAPATAPTIPPSAATAPPIVLKPFAEGRTPEPNYRPAPLASGAVTPPLARRPAAHAAAGPGGVAGAGTRRRMVAREVGRPSKPTAAPAAAARGPSAEQVKALYADTPFEEVPLDNMRRTIAARLTQAAQTIPHFYLTMDLSLD